MYCSLLKNILILPSGFKESLSATQVAEAIKTGVLQALPHANVNAIPIPDGGEDTAHILAKQTQGKVINTIVIGPLGQPIASYFSMLGGQYKNIAVIEIAAAAGLRLIPIEQRNPMLTTSYGVGELIKAAVKQGATRIILGCGDSGISDGGMGALQALGVKILDNTSKEVGLGGQYLEKVAKLDYSGLIPALHDQQIEICLALNPFNILCGPHGVAPVFAPQKGASIEQVKQLAQGFDHWAEKLAMTHMNPIKNFDFAYSSGSGASGGLGAGLAAIGAKLCPRFDVLLNEGLLGYHLDNEIKKADLIITAEGSIDLQTPHGKVPAEIAYRAAKYNKPVVALAGKLGPGANCVYEIGINAISSIIPIPMPFEMAIQHADHLLVEASERLIKSIIVGAKIASQPTESMVTIMQNRI